MNSNRLLPRNVEESIASTRQIATLLLFIGSMLVGSMAAAVDNPTTIVGDTNLGQSIGTGAVGREDYITVTIGDGTTPTAVRRQTGDTVISLYDYANITINSNSSAQGYANTNVGGHFNTGPNVIEFNSFSTVTIQSGAIVSQNGNTTNGEAINAHGFGNNIVNNGTIHSVNGAALWFQDTSVTSEMQYRNTVTNYGTISTDKGDGYNVFGSSRGGSGPGLVFNNYGTVKGSLMFGNGDDTLLFGPGSNITGNVDGGGGTNDLRLDANSGESATLGGSVKNFVSITKVGEGSWAILGQVPASANDEHPSSPINGTLQGIRSVTVQEGMLNIVGAAPLFDGTVQIDAAGTLSVQAQGINNASSITNNGSLLFDQPQNDTYTGQTIIGTGNVIKEGAGMLVMSSQSDNSYSGGTFIREGGIAVDQDSDLGAATGGITFGSPTIQGTNTNGTLRFDSSFDLASTRAITLLDGGGTIDTNGYDTNISQVISGTGQLTKAGAGTLNLTGTNTYQGGTVVTGGILGINSDAALGAAGSRLVLEDTTTLRLNGNINNSGSVRPVTLAGAPGSSMTIDTGVYTGVLNGTIDGNGRLVKQGTGELALYGANLYQGGTIIAQGTVAINSDNSLGGNGSTLEMRDQTTLRLDNNVTMTSRPINLNGAAGSSMTINTQGYGGTLNGVIDGGGALVKQGTGVLALYGNNTYAGGTTIAEGTVAINSSTSLGNTSGRLTMNDQTTLRLDNDIASDSRPITLNGGSATINTQANTGTFTGVIDGAGALVKQGTGTLALYGNNTYTGGTTLAQGTVAINSSTSLGNPSGRLTMNDQTTLRLDANIANDARPITLANVSATIDTQANNGLFTGIVAGGGALVKQGTGVLSLYGDNTYTGGTTIAQGTVAVNSSTSLGNPSGRLTMNDQTTLQLDNNLTADSRPITLSGGNAAINTQANNGTFTGTIDGGGALVKQGAGELSLYGNNSYAGGTTIAQGTVAINSSSSLGAQSGRLTMNDQTTLRLDADITTDSRPITLAGGSATINTQANTGSFGGGISGDGKLVKTGSGLLGLYGQGTYQGGTRVEQGTLAINSTSALGSESGALELYDQTTLRLDGNVNMASRQVILGGNGGANPVVTINTQGYDGTLNGTVSEAAANTVLEKTGTGTLALYGNNTYNGGTWGKNGTVAIKAATGLGSGDLALGDYDAAGGTGTTMGTLRADADLDVSATGKRISLNQGGGTINTNSFAVTLGENTLIDGTSGSTVGRNFHKTGLGTLAVINSQYYSGNTYIDQGTLQLDAVDPTAPQRNSKGLLNTRYVEIAAGARLEGQGLIGNSLNGTFTDPNAPAVTPGEYTTIVNAGTIAPGLERYHNTFDDRDTHFIPLTLAGNYRAMDGAAVEIHTQLIDDTSQHGTLNIDGVIDSASTATAVKVIHEGGDGATTDQGIEIIRLMGNGSTLTQDELRSQLRSNFYLASDFTTSTGQKAVVAGAYSYYMEDDDDFYEPAGNNGGLYLRNARHGDGSIVLHPGTPLYESYTLVLGTLSKLPTLEQRVGHRSWIFGGEASSSDALASLDTQRRKIDAAGVWIKAEGGLSKYKPRLDSNGNAKFDLDFARINLGGDMPLFHATDGSKLFGGLNLNVGRGKADVSSFHGDGDIDTDMFAIGGALTWFGSKGLYADAQARYTNFDSDIKSKLITSTPTLTSGNEGHGYAVSLELGQIFDLNQTWSLTPQAQLSYTTAKFNSFRDSTNSDIVNADRYKSLEGRLGVALNYEKSHCDSSGNMVRNKLYGLANMYHEFKGDATVSISTVQYKSKFNKTWAGLFVGGSRNWRNDQLSVYGEVGARSSTKHFGKEYVLSGEVGFRIMF